MEILHRRTPDYGLFAVVVALVAIGVVMIYSASSIVAQEQLRDSAFFLKRQLTWAALGIVAMAVAMRVHYQKLRRYTFVFLLMAVVFMIMVLVPPFGRMAGGARRWLTLGPLSFQPMEAAKLAFILYMARFLAFRGLEVREWRRGLLPPLLILGAFSGLALAQRDLGSALLMGIITMVMLFAGGARVLHLMTLTAVGMPTVFAAIRMQEYRWKRVIAFLNPWRDPQGTGFQIIQSLLALGSGGILGVGLGQSQQKFFYLPERHTDFIFAIVGEELGLLGTGFVLLLYLVFTYRGMLIAQRAPDRYGTLLAAGITAGITTQAMLNIGVISGVLPVTGVPLPFISFGGSSLVITSIGVGILLNISQYTTGWERRDEHAADDRGRRDGRPHLPRPRRR